MNTQPKSDFVKHIGCDHCGSSDANALYTDGHTHCFKCGTTTNGHTPMETTYQQPKKVTVLLTGDVSAIADRGISWNTCEAYKVMQTNGKHIYPYFDKDGKYVAQKIRDVETKDFSVKGQWGDAVLFGSQLFPKGGKYITLVEGELDALAAYQMTGSKWPVVSIRNGAQGALKDAKANYDYLNSFEKIYLSVDADDKAEKFAITLMNLFPNRVYKVPHDVFKDANEFLMADASDKFRNCWYNAGLFTPDNIYASEEDFLELLHDTPDHSYVPTGIVALDDKILGLMQGHFTVIKAPTGIGKSEFMRYLEYNLIKNHPNVRFATWHLEETKLRSLLGVVSYYLNDNLTRKDLIHDKQRMQDVEQAIKHITNKTGYMQFHLREEDGPDELIEQIRILTQVYGCKYVFFEPIQDVVTVSSDESKEAMLADMSVRLSKLAADLNVGIVTIGHTNDNGDFKYCRMIGQRASVIIDLVRDKEATDLIERNTTTLIVKKNRPCGLEGNAGELLFDGETFTLREKGMGW